MCPHSEFFILNQQISEVDWTKDNIEIKCLCKLCSQELKWTLTNTEEIYCLHKDFIIPEQDLYNLKFQVIPGREQTKVTISIECLECAVKQRSFLSGERVPITPIYKPTSFHRWG
jgi:hypothetical protein